MYSRNPFSGLVDNDACGYPKINEPCPRSCLFYFPLPRSFYFILFYFCFLYLLLFILKLLFLCLIEVLFCAGGPWTAKPLGCPGFSRESERERLTHRRNKRILWYRGRLFWRSTVSQATEISRFFCEVGRELPKAWQKAVAIHNIKRSPT